MNAKLRLVLAALPIAVILVFAILALRETSDPDPGLSPESQAPLSRGPAPDLDPSAAPETSGRVDMLGPEPESGGSLQGTVLDGDGRRSPYASVHVKKRESNLEPLATVVVADGDGEFRLALEELGEYVLWAIASGYGSSALQTVVLTEERPAAAVELALTQSCVLEGLVLDEEQQPVPKVRVEAYVDVELRRVELPEGRTSAEVYGRASAITDEQGRFRLSPLCDRGVPFVVEARLRVARTQVSSGAFGGEPEVSVRGGVKEMDFSTVLGGAASSSPRHVLLTAEDLDASPAKGEPLTLVLRPARQPGASLLLEFPADEERRSRRRVTYRLRHIDPRGGAYSERYEMGQVDAQGFLRVHDLRPGARYEIELRGHSFVLETTLGPFFALPGELRLRVPIPEAFEARVELVDPRGVIGEDAWIAVEHHSKNGVRKHVARATLEPGARTVPFRLPAGRYRLTLFAARKPGETIRRGSRPRAQDALATLEIEMPHHGARFSLELPEQE